MNIAMLLIDQLLPCNLHLVSSLYGEKVAELRKFLKKFLYDVAGFTLQCGESSIFTKLTLVSCNVRN